MPSVSANSTVRLNVLRLRLEYWVSRPLFPYVFGLALVGLTFKQFQRGAMFGIMEILAFALVMIALGTGRMLNSVGSRRAVIVALIIFSAFGASGLGAFVGGAGPIMLREVLAFGFSFMAVIAFIAVAAGREAYALRAVGEVIGWYCMLISIVSLTSFGGPLWYYETRLQGLSDNPNQIAFLALVGVALLGLFGSYETRNSLAIRLFVPCAGCVAAGTLSASDAFLLALLSVVAMAALVLVIGALPSKSPAGLAGKELRENPGNRRRALVLLLLACSGILANKAPDLVTLERLILIENPFFSTEHMPPLSINGLKDAGGTQEHTPSLSIDGLKDAVGKQRHTPSLSVNSLLETEGGQGYHRLALWSNAIRVILESPFVGYGPGVHVPSPADATLRTEAHNTVLDLLVVFGLAGTLPVIAVALYVTYRSWHNRLLEIILLAAAPLGVFSMFHFLARQPLFWIVLFGCAVAAGLLPNERSRFLSGSIPASKG